MCLNCLKSQSKKPLRPKLHQNDSNLGKIHGISKKIDGDPNGLIGFSSACPQSTVHVDMNLCCKLHFNIIYVEFQVIYTVIFL